MIDVIGDVSMDIPMLIVDVSCDVYMDVFPDVWMSTATYGCLQVCLHADLGSEGLPATRSPRV